MMASLRVAGIECEVVATGAYGQAEVLPSWPHARDCAGQISLPRHTLPCGLPPLLPDLDDELSDFLLKPEVLGIHSIERAQRFVRHATHAENMYSCNVSTVQSTIAVERNQTTGELIGYKEEFLEAARQTGKTSLLMTRPLGPPTDDVRGGPKNYPFWPGGMEIIGLDELAASFCGVEKDPFAEELLAVPPGFQAGMTFGTRKQSVTDSGFDDGKFSLDELSIRATDDSDSDDDGLAIDQASGSKQPSLEQTESSVENDENCNRVMDDIASILQEPNVLKISDSTAISGNQNTEWAVMVDVNKPVPDFYDRIPDMAYKWPFELDIFQKQAILHLENHDSVFVAAHTSAGKTVVAEYAIALSKKHMTRTIYTSPIKALSNQKFRDFKITFEDVGLITGDIQINQKASCLIMTTEILRSMLYGGSDVIRDLEWVVFDEVHYINDTERGVVWEEVLIMLPAHVSIILLSATVPNTMEFAEWVGRTKKRKVYVISTPKRPVPLEHFLYTGNSGKSSGDAKTSGDLHLLVDAEKNFLTQNYNKAVQAKKNPDQKDTKTPAVRAQTQHYVPKGGRDIYGMQQDKNIWLSVVYMLSKQEKLPAVAFTFSKKRIDDNCYSLSSIDLTTSSEKSAIHLFFQKCLHRLKPPDRELPQVTFMQELLKQGLAIHHSGVLPILKEIVELLFQKGLIKLLLATETFAMGVNMPARTVIFDSLRKHDGVNFRDLLPGEYIQMAGRAGRRGLDTTGTVIILCKAEVPEMSDLHKMLMGKPTQLESRFRLTYSMILNLLRVEHLRVQDMLRRSFCEFATQRDSSKHEKMQAALKQQISAFSLPDCYYCGTDLKTYCLLCQEYYKLRQAMQKSVVGHTQYIKALTCGRVVVLEAATSGSRRYALAVTLASATSTRGERSYTCLVLSDGHMSDRDWKEALGLASAKGHPTGGQHLDAAAAVTAGSNMASAAFTAVRDLAASDFAWLASKPDVSAAADRQRQSGASPAAFVVEGIDPGAFAYVSQRTLRISGDQVLEDHRRRQMPKYRNEPASQAFTAAVQDLRRLLDSLCAQIGTTSATVSAVLPAFDLVRDLSLHDMDILSHSLQLQSLRKRLLAFACLDCPSLDVHFDVALQQLTLEGELSRLQYLLSEDSLRLLPEYEQRVAVLRRLHYLDDNGTVQLKGRVAGYINHQEVPITELLFENVLSDLHHTDIAALLSCFVFEQKNCSEPNLVPSLAKGKDRIKQVATKIGIVQRECGLQIAVEDYVDELHFGLVEVVFEWARGMPFSEITRLTDVQEGLIVRCIQRLDETLRDVKTAAHVIGDPVLVQKMEDASRAIKRDIVFAASLYTQ